MSIIHFFPNFLLNFVHFCLRLFKPWLWLIPRLLAGLVSLWWLLVITVAGVQAETSIPGLTHPAQQLLADDFEHGLENWQLAQGQWADWRITNDGWLEANLAGRFRRTELVPIDAVWQNEWQAYQFEFDFMTLTNADLNWAWGWQDAGTWYEWHSYKCHWHLTRVVNGKPVFHCDGIECLNKNQAYHLTIIFDQGRIKLWIDDQLLIDRQDYSFEPGAVGKVSLKATTGAAHPTQVRYDNVRVYGLESSDDFWLPVESLKQYSQPWGDDEYDSAASWSFGQTTNQEPAQASIHRWGCALTSLAMVMRYYELRTLPDGTILDPGSLNTWLKRQADGYLGSSLNWSAATRLSRLIHETYSTPDQPLAKLEYARDYTPTHESVAVTLNAFRPQIVQIPGHFLVANGYPLASSDAQAHPELLTDLADFYISDPAYVYPRFSQHQASMASVIDFRPSQTDLSYLLLVYPPNLKVTLTDANGQPLDQVFYSQDSLADQFYEYDADDSSSFDQAQHSASVVQALPQPTTSRYQFQLSQSIDESEVAGLVHLPLYLYDDQAKVKMIDVYTWLGSDANETQFTLDFDKHDLTQAQLNSSTRLDFVCLQTVLEQQLARTDNRNSKELYLWLRLYDLSQVVSNCELTVQTNFRYQQLVFRLLFASEQAQSGLAMLINNCLANYPEE